MFERKIKKYTFFGENTSWRKDNIKHYEWVCLYGKLRICYCSDELKDGWKHISYHYYNLKKKKIVHKHYAFRWKYPFLVGDFFKIYKLYKDVK